MNSPSAGLNGRKKSSTSSGSIDRLNREMGTIFWSQEYDRFDQIRLPLNTIEAGTKEPSYAYYDNPSLHLDSERFASDSQIVFQNIQTGARRNHTTKTITTNGTGLASVDMAKTVIKMLSENSITGVPFKWKGCVECFRRKGDRGEGRGGLGLQIVLGEA